MNLSEKMTEWGILKNQLDALEKEIQGEVIALGSTQQVGNVVATYRKSGKNGSYNYRSMVSEIGPEPQIIENHTETTVVIDWKAIAEECKVSDELKKKYYTPPTESKPTVTVSLK